MNKWLRSTHGIESDEQKCENSYMCLLNMTITFFTFSTNNRLNTLFINMRDNITVFDHPRTIKYTNQLNRFLYHYTP